MKYHNLILTLTMMVGIVFGQVVTGFVGEGDHPLVGANVVVEGTDKGGVSDSEGKFTIETGSGTFDITASYIGYITQTKSISVGDIVSSLSFNMETDVVAMSALEVLASRADEKTPVAYTTVTKEEMEIRLGSQDIPMSLNMTPSVYATLPCNHLLYDFLTPSFILSFCPVLATSGGTFIASSCIVFISMSVNAFSK